MLLFESFSKITKTCEIFMKYKYAAIAALCLPAVMSNYVFANKHQSIMAIQGESFHSPMVNVDKKKYQSDKTYQVVGIITVLQSKKLGRDIPAGFYMQDSKGDSNPRTSDGIFVAITASELKDLKLQSGDKVTVTGKVKEAYGWTQLAATKINVQSRGHAIKPTNLVSLASDKSLKETLERYEGMRVTLTPSTPLVISRNFGFDRRVKRNNLALSVNTVNAQPNQHYAPNSKESLLHAKHIADNELILESFNRAPAGTIPWYPSFAQMQSNNQYNYMRIGDGVSQLSGVVGYSHKSYRLFVESNATSDNFKKNNPRTDSPKIKAGEIKVATFNVLNYFNSPFGGDQNPLKQNRGAKTQAEFEVQRTKIVNAIIALDADIVGLMEIENNGVSEKSALVDLVTHVNKQLPMDKQYSFSSDKNRKFNGTGAITSQVIYRAKKMSLTAFTIIDMPLQDAPASGKENGKNFMRNAITPTFKLKGSGQELTVSVNHFKSKGSTCWEDVALQHNKNIDNQGSCEQFRVSGAYHLAQELTKIKGHKLIIGDLNSYALEDPISVLTNRKHLDKAYKITAARDTFIGSNKTDRRALHGNKGAIINQSFGYLNTVRDRHPDAFGYSFSNVVGTLDYILASASLEKYIVDAVEWNINSPETTLFEYGRKYTGEMKKFNDVYRSSDHDPIIISLSFN